MILSLIVAADKGNVIGNNGAIPWSLPDDQKRFRALTKGKPVIMGRKTFDAIGRVLPDRRNIVVTRANVLPTGHAGYEVASSLDSAISLAEADAEEVFVIGGGQIYSEAMEAADKIYLTRVHGTHEGDAFFPAIDPSQWREVKREEHLADAKHAVPFTFIDYERK